ncbi:hypothetical protein BQ8482_110205 [Mesorhizobium delmotii]|uniref:Uncharacterized protein n=1 Tax=Mesorhizobium delmotii TaxID=1631247 RepID=A0A2P9AAV8_9HYPH|nr:hypothetical protein BQ8482_110205 [Mesorhizobium delmotii]
MWQPQSVDTLNSYMPRRGAGVDAELRGGEEPSDDAPAWIELVLALALGETKPLAPAPQK